jgi:hypothetical protein
LLAGVPECRGWIGAEAQRVASAVEAVVEAPAVRATVDEQLQVQTLAVVQTLPGIAGLDRLDRRTRKKP